MPPDRRTDHASRHRPARALSNGQQRRWRRLAVEFERLAVLHDGSAVELGSTTVTLRVRADGSDTSVLDRAEVVAANVPEVVVSRTDAELCVDVR